MKHEAFFVRDEVKVKDAIADPLITDDTGLITCYYGESGSLQDELKARLPHIGPIYKRDNAYVFTLVEKDCHNNSV